PGLGADTSKAQIRELLALVGKRADRLTDLKRLAADYARPRAERPQTEIKRLDQLAADRLTEETSQWGRALAVDASPAAKNLAKLLESYYRELIDLEEKEENLKKQRAEVEQLVGLTQKEAALLKRALPLIEKQVAQYLAAREEELVLVKARL